MSYIIDVNLKENKPAILKRNITTDSKHMLDVCPDIGIIKNLSRVFNSNFWVSKPKNQSKSDSEDDIFEDVVWEGEIDADIASIGTKNPNEILRSLKAEITNLEKPDKEKEKVIYKPTTIADRETEMRIEQANRGNHHKTPIQNLSENSGHKRKKM